MNIAVLIEAAEFLERRERGEKCDYLSALHAIPRSSPINPESEEKSFEPRWPRYDFPRIPRSAELGEKKARKIKQTWRFLSVHKTSLHQLLQKCSEKIAQFFTRCVLISLIASHGGAQLEFMIPTSSLVDDNRQHLDHNWLPSPKKKPLNSSWCVITIYLASVFARLSRSAWRTHVSGLESSIWLTCGWIMLASLIVYVRRLFFFPSIPLSAVRRKVLKEKK